MVPSVQSFIGEAKVALPQVRIYLLANSGRRAVLLTQQKVLMNKNGKTGGKRKSIATGTQMSSEGLPVLRRNVAGIDIASGEHWVCCPLKSDGSANVRTFGAMTCELEKIADWLKAEGVESVAMESTSV